MRLYVIAYPELAEDDYQTIQQHRKQHDRLYSMIEPHITFVFLVEDFTPEDFIAEAKQQLQGVKPFSFSLRCCTINKDSFSDNYFAFLVPDEGYSHVVKLHDKLYSGKLSYHHRLDIDYIPHIEIANAPDKAAIKTIVDTWNAKDFCINGRVAAIDIISFENGVCTTLEKVVLQA